MTPKKPKPKRPCIRANPELIEVMKMLTEGYHNPEDHFSNDELIHYTFGYPHREIYKRKIVARHKVSGFFWARLDDKDDGCIKTLQARTLRPGTTAYVRKDERDPDFVDIEAQFDTNAGTEWMTVSVDIEEYVKIGQALGAYDSCCGGHSNDQDLSELFGQSE